MKYKPIEWVTVPDDKQDELVAFGTDIHDWDHILEAAILGARLILQTSEEHGSPQIGECVTRAVTDLLNMRNSYATQMLQPVDPKKLN